MDRYIVTATVRRDGSSRFAEGNRFGTFPSFSAAWRIKEESFLKPVEIISDLKLRGSWGQSGNQNIGLFKYQGTYGPGPNQNDNRDYVFGREKHFATGLILQSLPNPKLTWETTTQADIGFDLGLLDNRINITLDYYNRKSEDFLLDIQVPVQTGYPTATRNVGSIRNSGLELSVEYRETRDNFQWGVSANMTTVNNKILSFADGLKSQGNFSNLGFPNYGTNTWLVYSQSNVGGEVGAFYGFESNGILQTQAEIDALNANAADINGSGVSYISAVTAPGDRNFIDQITVDTNGDGVPDARDGRITDDDRVIIGSPIPDWFGGLNLDASYKNFDVSIFFFGVFGNEILNYAKRDLQSLAPNGGVGVQNVGRDFYKNHWTPENPSNEFPRAVREDVSGNGRVSDAFVEDGSFVRLRNIQIGYTLPQELAGGVIKKARIYVSGQNLLTFTKYSGLDPEIGEVPDQNGNRSVTANGIDLGNYPNPRGFTVGVNLQF
jgi:TonB-linked SusC/RagA family outer membrane protein